MNIRDRVKELRRVKASELMPNPKNWRTHPTEQHDALRGILAEVGIAGALLARETDAGLQLIDGHLRADTSPDTEWPVLVLDVDEAEADKLLATYDPLSAMAEADAVKLDELLRGIDTGSEALQQMLADLVEGARLYQDEEDASGSPGDSPYTNKIVVPVYEPKGDRPAIADMIDRTKTVELIAGIQAANLPPDVAKFLEYAAERHTVFHFRNIAEFYCHASEQVQDLMERSGMVIIDFDKAIEYGFVDLTEQLEQLAGIENEE